MVFPKIPQIHKKVDRERQFSCSFQLANIRAQTKSSLLLILPVHKDGEEREGKEEEEGGVEWRCIYS